MSEQEQPRIVTPEAVYGMTWDQLDAKLKPLGYRSLRRMVQVCKWEGEVAVVVSPTETAEVRCGGQFGYWGTFAYLSAVERLPKPKMERVSFVVPAGVEVGKCRWSDNGWRSWTTIDESEMAREEI